ncbi:helix-turn-helix transcriptional regulator [Streptomyces sp. NPDC127091]|uniref:helix-turn-helix transcriptional regulator n=1 Tax=Streptomyces sp. NPDC127091 TaxID=3347134 RepID=UPI0036606113
MQDSDSEVAELVHTLRHLREAQGNPTLKAISRRTGGFVSIATLSRLFSGKALPSMAVVLMAAQALTSDQVSLAKVRAQYLVAIMERDFSTAQHARPTAESLAKDPDVQRFQDELQTLVRSAGLSIRELARRTRVPKSTISDALKYPRLPKPEVVSAIATACNVDPHPWLKAATELAESRVLAPSLTQDVEEEQRGSRSPQPVNLPDVLIETAATRSPSEIAALVTTLKENGKIHVAARLVEAVAKQRNAEDVAALAIALLDSAPASDGTSVEAPTTRQESTGWFPWRRREAS